MERKQDKTNGTVGWLRPIVKAQNLLKTTDFKEKETLIEYFYKEANYNLLLRVQIYQKLWEDLLLFPDIFFRRVVNAKAYNLSQEMISDAIGISSGASHNFLHYSTEPAYDTLHSYAVMVNVPWQSLVKKRPIVKSYSEPTEYYIESVKEKRIEDLLDERVQVNSVKGYRILNPEYLFDRESDQVTGRWVRSFKELEYFEFHLDREPVLHIGKIEEIFKLFPFATHLVTTYTPFRPNKRSFWILGPKPGKEKDYEEILPFIRQREKTIVIPPPIVTPPPS